MDWQVQTTSHDLSFVFRRYRGRYKTCNFNSRSGHLLTSFRYEIRLNMKTGISGYRQSEDFLLSKGLSRVYRDTGDPGQSPSSRRCPTNLHSLPWCTRCTGLRTDGEKHLRTRTLRREHWDVRPSFLESEIDGRRKRDVEENTDRFPSLGS